MRPNTRPRWHQRLLTYLTLLAGWKGAPWATRRDRLRQVRVTAIIGLSVGPAFALYNSLLPDTRALGAIEIAAVCGLILPAWTLAHKRHHVGVAESLMMVGAAIIFTALVVLGGVDGTGLFWVYAWPFLAFFLNRQGAGWVYSLGLTALLAAYFVSPLAQQPWAWRYAPHVPGQFVLSLLFYTVLAANLSVLRMLFEARLRRRLQAEASESRALTARLQHLATHDSVTGLPNRVGLSSLLTRAVAQTKQTGGVLWVGVLRLQRLGALSNVLGPGAADRLLRQVVDQLGAAMQGWGNLARLRRDELVVWVHDDAAQPEARAQAERLLGLTLDVREQGVPLYVEFVLGLSATPTQAGDADTVLRQAEQALLQAVAHQQPWVLYDNVQEARFRQHHLLFGALRDALEAQALQLHYQPQVDLRNGRIVGAEALVRWTDAQRGWVSPADFIPIAEESGLIRPLTLWVLQRGLRDCAAWHAQGHAWSVSLNLSAQNLLQPDLVQQVRQALAHSGVPSRWVNLEVTESSFMSWPQRALDVLHELHALGLSLSIDDFGTGYSSLAYLKNMPIQELKIDQTFVRHLSSDANDQTIVRATIDLAHQFGLTVVAEGIEDAATSAWLADQGCDIGQGYHHARPMPLNQLLELGELRCSNQQGSQPDCVNQPRSARTKAVTSGTPPSARLA